MFMQMVLTSRICLYGHENEMYNVGVEVKDVECL